MFYFVKSALKEVREDPHLKEVLKGATSALAIRTLGMVLNFVVGIVIARLFSAQGAGIYFLSISVVAIASTISRFGFDNTVVRFVASHTSMEQWGDVVYINRIAVRIVTVVSILVSILLFISAGWMAETLFNKQFIEAPLKIVSLAVMPLAILMIQGESLRGLKSIATYQIVQSLSIPLFTLSILYPFVRAFGPSGSVVAYLIAVVITCIIAFIMWEKILKKGSRKKIRRERTLSILNLFESSWPLFGVALTGLVMQQAGTIFLGMWGTAVDVGIYNIASRIAGLLLFPLMAMISIIAPKFAEMHKKGDMISLQKLARSSSRILSLVSIPATLGVVLFNEKLLSVFGEEFLNGKWVLLILLIGVTVNTMTGAVSEILMMGGKEKDCRLANVYGAVIIITLCCVLVPLKGAIGAASGVTIGIAGKNLIMAYMVYKRFGFWPISIIHK